MKYLLSNGLSTSSVEYYVKDIFSLLLNVYPYEVPGLSEFGFDFNLAGITKNRIPEEISLRAKKLVDTAKHCVGDSIGIELVSTEVISEEKAIITVKINNKSENIEIKI